MWKKISQCIKREWIESVSVSLCVRATGNWQHDHVVETVASVYEFSFK